MSSSTDALADPRAYSPASDAPADVRQLFALAEAALAASTGDRVDALNAQIHSALRARLDSAPASVTSLLNDAPSADVARHLWRQVEAAARASPPAEADGISAVIFAIPIVVVAALDREDASVRLTGTLAAPEALAAILREHRALAGIQNFALADALVAADAIDIAHWREMQASAALRRWSPPPAPIEVATRHEGVHLRFVVGVAMARAGVALAADARVGAWGVPFTRELGRQIALPGVSVLALPRVPLAPFAALRIGQTAQREIAAQVFVSNAIRKLRAEAGEPIAVLSAHRLHDGADGGELRLSLSSPLSPRDAEGFRCPLYPQDRVDEVETMLADLVRDCRVADLRVRAGVHPDRDPVTGAPLMFKAEHADAAGAIRLH